MNPPCFRIATYNLQKCVGMDLRRRPGRSLRVLAALEADVVVLQEADKRLPPRPAALPHDMLEAAGWSILPFGQPGGSLGWHGNAMLVRGGIGVLGTAHLDLPGLEPRGAIRADLKTPQGPVRVIGMHLGLMRRYRLLQLAAIRRALDRLPGCPTVLAGDFNEWGSDTALSAGLRGFGLLPTPPSFPAPRPVAQLDRLAVGEGLTALRLGTLSARPAPMASDHLPVWADIAHTPPD